MPINHMTLHFHMRNLGVGFRSRSETVNDSGDAY